jgi:polyisoprenoid-binding protein YceI
VRRSTLIAGVAAAVVIVGAAGVYGFATLFLHPAPSAVTLDPGSSQPAASIGTLPTGAGSTLSAGLDGTWSIDTSIGSFSDFSDSWMGYRVDETLAGNRANTAVGRTPDVTGTLALSGTQVTSVDVSVDVSTLQSDDNRRDGQLHRRPSRRTSSRRPRSSSRRRSTSGRRRPTGRRSTPPPPAS